MARGQYELPQGRTRPVFGPARPPASPPSYGTGSNWARRSASTLPSPTSLSPLSTASKPRPVILYLCLAGPQSHANNNDALGAKLRSEATIEEVQTVEAALDAMSRNPTAVIIPDDILRHPSFALLRTETSRYVQNGGTLITDLSQIQSALAHSCSSTPDSVDGGYTERYLVPKSSP